MTRGKFQQEENGEVQKKSGEVFKKNNSRVQDECKQISTIWKLMFPCLDHEKKTSTKVYSTRIKGTGRSHLKYLAYQASGERITNSLRK